MREDNRPNDDQLKELYQAAADFKEAQPWKWLYDSDIICVENPKDKTIGFCSVMGRAGEHYALGVYLGDEGIFGFYNMMENGDSIPGHQVLHHQNCIMCSFEDRNTLSTEDRKQIKALGLSFRGRNAWPMFRRYEPGFHPWYINEEECIFLTIALRQALFVATNVLDSRLSMDMERGKTILRFSEDNDGRLEWYSKEIQLTYPFVSYSPVEIIDDVLIQKLKKAGSMGNITLLAETCYMPSAVQENKGERPYYPRIFILAEKETGMVMDFEIYESIDDDADVMLNKLIDIFIENGTPKEIQVRGEDKVAILGDFCKRTGIKLKVAKRLSAIDHMIEGMTQRF